MLSSFRSTDRCSAIFQNPPLSNQNLLHLSSRRLPPPNLEKTMADNRTPYDLPCRGGPTRGRGSVSSGESNMNMGVRSLRSIRNQSPQLPTPGSWHTSSETVTHGNKVTCPDNDFEGSSGKSHMYKEDGSSRSSTMVKGCSNVGGPKSQFEEGIFDICRTESKGVQLKKSLLEQNREKNREFEQQNLVAQPFHLRPGMILLKKYISHQDQVSIIKCCREIGIRKGGFYRPGYMDGSKLHLQMMCLGQDWDPETRRYDTKRQFDGATPPPIPDTFNKLVNGAVRAAHDFLRQNNMGDELPLLSPEICIVNFYSNSGKLGFHKDRDESEDSIRKGVPIVSFSVGDSAEFLYGKKRDVDMADKIVLESGDVLIFGGESWSLFHGVSSIFPNTAPKRLIEESELKPGRLNLTFRQVSSGESNMNMGIRSLRSIRNQSPQPPTPGFLQTSSETVTHGNKVTCPDNDFEGSSGKSHMYKEDGSLRSSIIDLRNNSPQRPRLGQPSSDMVKGSSNVGGPKSQFEEGIFDICRTESKGKSKSVQLNKSLLEQNREKKREFEQQNLVALPNHLRRGMILLKKYISHQDQVSIIKCCREIGIGKGGFYRPGYSDDSKLHLQMMCLGQDWDPETRRYESKRRFDGATPPPIPDTFSKLVNGAVRAAHDFLRQNNMEDELPLMSPEICIVNFYSNNGKLGLHQDRDESEDSIRKGVPIVSFSIGDSAEFLYGEKRDVDMADKIVLESGDVLIFGGKSRSLFHGVSSISPNTAPKRLIEESKLKPGRLNLTFRQL